MKILQVESFIEELECTVCGKKYSPNEINNLCTCGKVLFAKYDIEKAKESINKDSFVKRPTNIWRIAEIMPVIKEENRLTLGEGFTPLLHLDNLSVKYKGPLLLKDEGQNPTGSFKARGLAAAISKAKELGVKECVIPSAGNAGAALAAYCAKANIKAHIYVPIDAPKLIIDEIRMLGADLQLVDGLISDAGKIAKEQTKMKGWFDVSTLKEPYRVEGKKTMGLELAEQLNWQLPDVIIYPTGGGTGIIGMWKAFDELEKLGLIGCERPKMVTVQSSGCAPIVKAFNEGKEKAEFWENANTIAAGLRVPTAIGDYLILRVLRESKGTAVQVSDDEIIQAMHELAKEEGVLVSTEGAAPLSAYKKLKEDGWIDKKDSVVLFGTGSGLTMPDTWQLKF